MSQFGINYLRCEEIVSYDAKENGSVFIDSIAYYDVFGRIEKEFTIKEYGCIISFKANKNIPVGHEKGEEYFWIVIETNMPYILDEEYECSYVESKKKYF